MTSTFFDIFVAELHDGSASEIFLDVAEGLCESVKFGFCGIGFLSFEAFMVVSFLAIRYFVVYISIINIAKLTRDVGNKCAHCMKKFVNFSLP